LPTLREGAQGKYVHWLQSLLNQHKAAQQPLPEDSAFGPKTQAAVLNFQRSQSLVADGVVGRQTWLKVVMLAPEVRSWQRVPPHLNAAFASVHDWSLGHRFERVLSNVPNHMSRELGNQFHLLVTSRNAAILAASLAVWAISHAFGVGELVDIGFLGMGAFFLGRSAFDAGEDIGQSLMHTLHAETRDDLDVAADYLAHAIAIIGVTAFLVMVTHVGAKFGRAAGAAEEDAAVAARPRTRPLRARVAEEPIEPAPRPTKSAASEVAEEPGAKTKSKADAKPEMETVNPLSTEADRAAFHEQFGAGRYAKDANYIESLRASHPEWDAIPTEDLVAVRGYTSSDYSLLNEALRSGDPAQVAQVDAYVKCASSGLEQLPSYNGLTVRGVDLTADQAAGYVPGTNITEQAFTSTTANPATAFSGNTTMTFKSVTGSDVSGLSNYPAEHEVLFPPGTQFKVLDNVVDPTTGIRNISLIQTGGN
jgi:hypothetical protein